MSIVPIIITLFIIAICIAIIGKGFYFISQGIGINTNIKKRKEECTSFTKAKIVNYEEKVIHGYRGRRKHTYSYYYEYKVGDNVYIQKPDYMLIVPLLEEAELLFEKHKGEERDIMYDPLLPEKFYVLQDKESEMWPRNTIKFGLLLVLAGLLMMLAYLLG